MFTYPDIDPVAFAIGPVKVHWYGLMYLLGFVAAYALARIRAKRGDVVIKSEHVDDLIFVSAIGVIVGGRIGYMLFYNPGGLIQDPLSIIRIWDGGMSFHGGLLGVLIAMGLFAKRIGCGFFQVSDFLAPMVTIGLGAGRIGNFINGELWGKVTDSPLGFEVAGQVRHATQLYEAFLEGLVMFVILWWYSAKPRPTMAVSGLFLVLYGVFRFAVEFVRVPDEQYDYLAFGWLTMGQVLSAPMVVFGLLFLWLAYARQNATPQSQSAS